MQVGNLSGSDTDTKLYSPPPSEGCPPPTKILDPPLYHSVNADRAIILFGGGGDTVTLFCTERRWGAKKRKIALMLVQIDLQWFYLFACWHAANVYGVVILVGGGGDTWTLFCVIKLVWTFCTKRRWGAKNENLPLGQPERSCPNGPPGETLTTWYFQIIMMWNDVVVYQWRHFTTSWDSKCTVSMTSLLQV